MFKGNISTGLGMLNGADISGWQPPQVNEAGLVWVAIKATQGVNSVNQNFAAQLAESRANGLVVFTYHYADGRNTPEAEAAWYCKNNDSKDNEGTALDVEGDFFTNVADADAWAYAFNKEVYRLQGTKNLMYMNNNSLVMYSWAKCVAFNDGLWLALWNGQNAPLPEIKQFPVWAMWQYADTNQTGGDSDYFNGDVATLKKYAATDPNWKGPVVPPIVPPVNPPKPKPPVKPVIPTFNVWVDAGDTMSSIATQFNVSLQLLEQVNPQIKDFNVIYVGELIHVPGHAPNPKKYCVVSAGDTMSSIAAQFGTTVAALEAVNPQVANFNLIYPGQVLYLP